MLFARTSLVGDHFTEGVFVHQLVPDVFKENPDIELSCINGTTIARARTPTASALLKYAVLNNVPGVVSVSASTGANF